MFENVLGKGKKVELDPESREVHRNMIEHHLEYMLPKIIEIAELIKKNPDLLVLLSDEALDRIHDDLKTAHDCVIDSDEIARCARWGQPELGVRDKKGKPITITLHNSPGSQYLCETRRKEAFQKSKKAQEEQKEKDGL